MKFERLTVPAWQLPDLVAFNQRVHERVDPVVGASVVPPGTWAGCRLVRAVRRLWIYFASGLPSSDKLLAYEPPLPTNVRGNDGDPGPDLRSRAARRALL